MFDSGTCRFLDMLERRWVEIHTEEWEKLMKIFMEQERAKNSV